MKTSYIFFLFVCLFCVETYSQNNINVEEVFKMQLFLNKRINQFDTFLKKDNSSYNLFINSFEINVDTLKVYNFLNGNYYNEFDFYYVDHRTIFYNANYDKYNIKINLGVLSYYILCINNKTGTCYRLAGFDINDFHYFLKDFQKIYEINNLKRLSANTFLKKFKVERLNFLCLNTELKKNKNKTPLCLFKNEDPIVIW